jgi:hypothetical protein
VRTSQTFCPVTPSRRRRSSYSSRRGEAAVSYLECEEPGRIAARLAASTEPFDVWLKARLAEFHGCDFARPDPGWSPELVFESGETGSFVSEGKTPDGTEEA